MAKREFDAMAPKVVPENAQMGVSEISEMTLDLALGIKQQHLAVAAFESPNDAPVIKLNSKAPKAIPENAQMGVSEISEMTLHLALGFNSNNHYIHIPQLPILTEEETKFVQQIFEPERKKLKSEHNKSESEQAIESLLKLY